MKLSEIFYQLTTGELSQIGIGGAEAGEINESNYDRIAAHINLGLTALFSRFPLKKGKLKVALQSDRTLYPLTTAYAVSNTRSKEPVKYILDTAPSAKFTGDLLKIERVFTDSGNEFVLNDSFDPLSLTTPNLTTLEVPEAIVAQGNDLYAGYKTENLIVEYRANANLLPLGTESLNPEAIEIELPYSHLEALIYFVASRVHNPIGMSNEFHTGNSYAAKYERACQALEDQGLFINQVSGNNRLTRNGWV